MSAFLQWLFGVDSSPGWAAGGDWHVQFNSLPQGTWAPLCALIAAAAVAGVWFLYHKEGRQVRLAVRIALASLRLLALLIVAFMLVELVVVLTKKEYVRSHLLILMDTSESMSLQDPYTDQRLASETAKSLGLMGEDGEPDFDELRKEDRLQLAKRGLARVYDELAQGRELALYGFANGLKPMEGVADLENIVATGPGTAIGEAIRNALAAHRGQPLAGILLLSDGQSNAGEDPLKVAEHAGTDGVPITSLAIGTIEGPRNARVAELEASPIVFVRDPIEIGVLVESRGLRGSSATVTLEERKEGGTWQEIGRELITLGEDAALQRISFRITPEATGQIDFRAQVLDVGPELTTSDNIAHKSVKVIRQKIRVLLIAGGPSNEMQFLRNAILRDTALEFSSWLQSAAEGYEHVGHRPLRRLPATQEELDRFDVLILFDPDMRKLGSAWPEMLVKFVGNAGGGLVYVAGEQYSQQLFAPGISEESAVSLDTSWLKILPVVRDPGLYQSTAEVRLSSRESYTLELTPEGKQDSIFRFAADPARNREILQSLPGMYWHFPVTRSKPGATILARHGDPRMTNSFGRHVMMATHLYGPGRTMFIAFDSTYRWRYLAEDYFDGFWARTIDRVGRSKLLGGRYPFTLAADKSAYRVGDRVTVTARFTSSTEVPSSLANLSGELEIAAQPAQPLSFDPQPDEPGAFQATFVANEPGPYLVRVLPSAEADSDAAPRAATLEFRVETPRLETENATLNRILLDGIAKGSGGQSLTLAEIEKVASAFPIRQVERVLEFRDEVWDAPIMVGSLVCLLTLEWVLRKRYRMA
jgi:hypothetical protein